VPWCYGEHSEALPVLKPHGSINWIVAKGSHLTSIAADGKVGYDVREPFEDPENLDTRGKHLIYPGEPEDSSKEVWSRVEIELHQTNRVIFIGYSMPDYDSFVRSCFSTRVSGNVLAG